jgi:hypothetical protein
VGRAAGGGPPPDRDWQVRQSAEDLATIMGLDDDRDDVALSDERP